MHDEGLTACQQCPDRVTTEVDAEAAGMPPILKGHFTADGPRMNFVSDITY